MGKAAIRRRTTRTRACTSKEGRYDTLFEAWEAARNWMTRNPGCLSRIGYPCPYSRAGDQHFHFGKELGSGKPPARQRRI